MISEAVLRRSAGHPPHVHTPAFSIPKTTVMPPLEGRGPAPLPRSPGNSMGDSAREISELPVLIPYAVASGPLIAIENLKQTAKPDISGKTFP
ncbi:uncharacterized protein MYCFIDRAFT_209782 [Pseudocercospora fijiensis CIRAD86]|uniref:Uncharacterized protein n=1 Tax=Pseudocercospora fijiensis (strain CIRAD86) TaxID=383855 RepID=N1QB55_PSEFD|nr:uncharacterized protein MYCFIDRAFT_209782 [Pseudocercospora fijiensis CIRAD86]EME88352.1 hypothetical protein MYCFIDRAFT_209782 [Pseudocercospora fijiensis CIRAD86]